MSAAEPLRVLICDDDPMIRLALHDLIAAEPDLDVVGVAEDADQAISLAERLAPGVVVLDVRMPGGGGTRAAREIRLRSPDARILAFSAYADRTVVAEMRRVGAAEYLLKGVSNDEIVAAVRRVGRSAG